MLAGAQGRRCSIASSALLVLVLLAGCCFCSPTRPQSAASKAMPYVGGAENTTGDQKEPKKMQKGGDPAAAVATDDWWANPCGMPNGVDRKTPIFSSSVEVEMDNMRADHNLAKKWVKQLNITITHIKNIEQEYQAVSSHNSQIIAQKNLDNFLRSEFALFFFS
jgi:hypothetical protein